MSILTLQDLTSRKIGLTSHPAQIEGAIPPELLGTFFRNGPGLQVDRPGHQRHTFDGDGMVLSMAFKDGKAFFRNRYVRTLGFVDEQVSPFQEHNLHVETCMDAPAV